VDRTTSAVPLCKGRFIIGLLAAQAALAGGKTTDTQALSNDLTQPFGKVLLGLVAIGLIGYVLLGVLCRQLRP